jgi:hypothetical protein
MVALRSGTRRAGLSFMSTSSPFGPFEEHHERVNSHVGNQRLSSMTVRARRRIRVILCSRRSRMSGRRRNSILVLSGAVSAIFLGLATNVVSAMLPPGWSSSRSVAWAMFAISALAFTNLALWQFWLGRDDGKAAGGQVSERGLHRDLMLERVRVFWIEGALAHSVDSATAIELGLESRPTAVDQPWTLIARDFGSRSSYPVEPGTTALQLFDRLGGSLLILGAPGAGKTTLLLELTRDLLQRAAQDRDYPMPVVFNLSSWSTERESLDIWMENELHLRYDVPRRIGRAWLQQEMILPLLDGLDEVAPRHRPSCVRVINEFRRQSGLVPLVVCSRLNDYENLDTRLRLAGAVLIQPLSRQQLQSHLDAMGDRVDGLRSALRHDSSLWDLLVSPLFLNIAALAFRDRPTESLSPFGRIGDHRTWLIRHYVERMLSRRADRHGYSPADTVRWLGVLAAAMIRNKLSIFYLEWIQPAWLLSPAQLLVARLLPQVLVALLILVVSGSIYDYANKLGEATFHNGSDVHVLGIPAGWLLGGAMAVGGAFLAFDRGIQPAEEIGWSWGAVRANLRAKIRSGIVRGMSIGVPVAIIFKVWGWRTALLFGLAFFAQTMFLEIALGGLSPRVSATHTTPNEGIRRSIRNAVVVALPTASLFAVFTGLALGAKLGAALGLVDSVGTLFIVFVAVALPAGGRAWLQHYALRVVVAAANLAPLRCIRFLDYAGDRILLRRVGGGYMFIHRTLLEYFAWEGEATLGAAVPVDVRAPP